MGVGAIALPLDKVFEAVMAGAAVEDSFNLELIQTIDYYGWRRVLESARDGVLGRGFQKRDMEDGVDPHRRGEVKFVGPLANICEHLDRAKLRVV